MDIQFQEEMEHGRDGILYCGELVSYECAVRNAGGDTAETLRGEDERFAMLEAEERERDMDAMEARGGPAFDPYVGDFDWDNIPF